ncbi:predicted protein [Nematostella vectensis]|uniref:Uncharacterized protein n=1 Tax=Nematostella vectensis TaxID=45351 RepID=A7RI77_NEMVE|nr:predicted protein [Nematostella vectensis]|eukprot:XP_001640829.1 predicted protein [Nematostella vectensis]
MVKIPKTTDGHSESDSEETKYLINTSTSSITPVSADKLLCKVYKRRWYILFIYSFQVTLQNAVWNFWGPIQESCKIVFGWEKFDVLLISVWGPASAVIALVPGTWVLARKGLRPTILLTSFFICIGKALQIVPFTDQDVRTAVVNIGQMIAMTSSFMTVCVPAVLSAVWFPPHERATATTLAMVAGYIGSAASFAVGPQIVPDPESFATNFTNHISAINVTDADKQLMATRIAKYMYGELGLLIFVTFCLILYFPSKPPLPPSLSTRSRKKTGLKSELSEISRDVWFWLLTFVFSVSYGSYYGWISVLDVAVAPFEISEDTAGWLGCLGSLAGVLSAILAARCADLTRRYTKLILIILFTGSTLCLLFFTITCERYIPYSEPLLYVYIIGSGLFFTGTTPLFFELIIEYVYPVSDSLATGNLLLWSSVLGVVFCVVFMFPSVDVTWMNWVNMAGCSVCVPVLILFKEKYTRLDLDLGPHIQ